MRYWLALGLLVLGLVGCANTPVAGPAPTAAAATSETKVTVRELIDHSDQYANRPLLVSGKIVMECTEGCWFFMDDGTARLYVDLKSNGLTIPQMIGAPVLVHGRISGSGGNVQIFGEKIEFPK